MPETNELISEIERKLEVLNSDYEVARYAAERRIDCNAPVWLHHLITTIESQDKELKDLKESQSVKAISERTMEIYNVKRQLESQKEEIEKLKQTINLLTFHDELI